MADALNSGPRGKIVMGARNPDCSIPVNDHIPRHSRELKLLKRVSRETDTPIFQLDQYLCNSQTCMAELDGTLLYRD